MLLMKDEGVRKSLSRMLRTRGVRVLECSRLPDALGNLMVQAPALLAVDLVLCRTAPEMIIEAIHKAAPETRVVICTSESEPGDAEAIEKGVFFYAAGMDVNQLGKAILAGLGLKEHPP